MKQLLEKIHSCNDHERHIFRARLLPFNESMDRWHSDERPGQENNNFFAVRGRLTSRDIQAAVDFQKRRGLHYVMLRSPEPLPEKLVEEFGLEQEKLLVMALEKDGSGEWKENPDLEIRDIQTHDITADLLDVSDVPTQYQAQALQNMQMVLEVARDHPEYHWLHGYMDGKKVASAYALCYDGCTEMDDLWVEEDFRNQYIATTLMKHIARNLGGTFYLHADAARTPKDMYAKMGFGTVETTYDYFLEWE